ncbi:MAG: hypothetical protein HXX08_11735 [Chloroflexi bacterium]|uniref:Uncharacterized protein n=1 Tax=Candidatus Chlorohelix allophototropha TaxID=3003348 RepID=A0A8T7M2V8_9CHLR|nr:hypothetical protein [Chloroflexota bacterium]WJW65910.1 hypothetical protein OZ401_001690 [Chloroflexota bacterium L227-S17]
MSDYYLAVLVLDDEDFEEEVINLWAEKNARAITALDCEQFLMPRNFNRDDLPLFPGLSALTELERSERRLLFALVKSREALQQLYEETRHNTGADIKPGKALFFGLPLALVQGL